jgi:hypothetical protein
MLLYAIFRLLIGNVQFKRVAGSKKQVDGRHQRQEVS